MSQRLFNRAMLLALEQLADDLERTERANQIQERRIQDLEQRLANLERVDEESEVELCGRDES